MISLLRTLLLVIPWILLLAILSWLLIEEKLSPEEYTVNQETYQTILLSRVENMGNLELVRYNFQEVTELKKIADSYDFKFFKWKVKTDSKAVLISSGSAAGCIDLTKVKASHISTVDDTLYVTLPAPNICFFKIDLEKSRIYDLQMDYLRKEDQPEFMEELYSKAEESIKNSALDMGILDKAGENGITLLKPLFEEISKRPVVITYQLPEIEIPTR